MSRGILFGVTVEEPDGLFLEDGGLDFACDCGLAETEIVGLILALSASSDHLEENVVFAASVSSYLFS